MLTNGLIRLAGSTSLVLFGFTLGMIVKPAAELRAQGPRIFELRTYTAPDGKLADLHARFRSHTLRIFQKHGMTNVVYFSTLDAPLSQNTLIYLLAHSNREAAKRSWDAFRNDPEWKKVAAETQANGPIVSKVESVFLEATDYSPMK
jgi:NIPSNAP